ncbi:hypothetical protein [Companilactobacillus sp. HBUAS56257]|uniref:hypothetical protein n=1 Tax=Companilactobacillus sp. HBUAS56257 TaxID=3109360 RepID=UPI002FF15AB5
MLVDVSNILTNSSDQDIAKQLGISATEIELIKNKQLYPPRTLTKKIIQLAKQPITVTQPALEKNFQFGQTIKLRRVIISIIFIIFVSLLFTGFGYQPFWIFLLVVLIGLFVTLPSCFNDYWLINEKNIKAIEFNNLGIIKLAQLLHLAPMPQRVISYSEIDHINIFYHKRIRTSPFDINPDVFQLTCTLKNNQELTINVNAKLEEELIDLVDELNYQNIAVYDQQKIILALSKSKNLFQNFNPTYP